MRSVSSLQPGAPAPRQTAAVSACPQRPLFSFQARRSQGQAAVWETSPARWAHEGEARTDWVMTGQPPAQPGASTPWQRGQAEGSPRTRLPSPLPPHRTFHRERWNLHSEQLLPSTGTFPGGSWGCLLLLLADPGGLQSERALGWGLCCSGQVAPILAQDTLCFCMALKHPCYAETLLQLKETGDHLALPSPGWKLGLGDYRSGVGKQSKGEAAYLGTAQEMLVTPLWVARLCDPGCERPRLG